MADLDHTMSGNERHWLNINRAPVLTPWATVVAGLNAYSKGKSLGIFEPGKKKVSDSRKCMKKK